jgi:transposase
MRMLMVGYCYGIRSERRLCEEVKLHLAYRWFCRLDLDDKVPHHSMFCVNRLGRFRESDILRHIFERVVVRLDRRAAPAARGSRISGRARRRGSSSG